MSQLNDFRKGEENIFEFEYSGSFVSVIVPPGFYFLEVFGAEGGKNYQQSPNVSTGLGGYSSGALNLNKETLFFVFVGGKGGDCSGCSSVSGGFNGGGSVSKDRSGGGGGGSDIRVEIDDFHHRIIVAGGGGGLEYSGSNGYSGSGGGSSGQNGYQPGRESTQGGGGSSTSPGSHHGGGTSSSFGTGGSSIVVSSGGGGGGWYGGGAGGIDGNGGGGSGYVYSSETSYQYPLPKPSEEFYLTNCTSENGVRTGHGFARITFIGTSFSSKNHANQSLICIHANYIQYFANLLLIIYLK